MSKLFSRFNLQFTFIKNKYISIYFFIVKILTDFRKTVETGMDPRLHWLLLKFSFISVLIDFCDYFFFGFTTLNRKAL